MIQEFPTVLSNVMLAQDTYILKIQSERIAKEAQPGQFLNVRVYSNATDPLLRRPFSISRIDGEIVELIVSVVGKGTQILSEKKPGDRIDILGPLGNAFRFQSDYQTALLVAGGVGIAPFPFLTQTLQKLGKKIVTLAGFRTSKYAYIQNLLNVHVSTDDGSQGTKGTVLDLLRKFLDTTQVEKPKIFACGPMQMLHALTEFARQAEICCEMSLEGEMACGVGLCQGCPVERLDGNSKFALVCRDGPNFLTSEVQV